MGAGVQRDPSAGAALGIACHNHHLFYKCLKLQCSAPPRPALPCTRHSADAAAPAGEAGAV